MYVMTIVPYQAAIMDFDNPQLVKALDGQRALLHEGEQTHYYMKESRHTQIHYCMKESRHTQIHYYMKESRHIIT
jgi:hypothetical protein